jgi:hypothetical protein
MQIYILNYVTLIFLKNKIPGADVGEAVKDENFRTRLDSQLERRDTVTKSRSIT